MDVSNSSCDTMQALLTPLLLKVKAVEWHTSVSYTVIVRLCRWRLCEWRSLLRSAAQPLASRQLPLCSLSQLVLLQVCASLCRSAAPVLASLLSKRSSHAWQEHCRWPCM